MGEDLVGQDHFHKLLIVDVSRGVFLAMDQILYVFLVHFLAQTSQHMSQFSRSDETIAILVEMTETFNEVLRSVSDFLRRNGLQNGQKGLK